VTLERLVVEAARATPQAAAVTAPDGTLSYRALDALANRLARALRRLGVGKGDRVGLWLEKSATGVAAMQACLRLGAAYVPLDPTSPLARITQIVDDARMAAVVCTPDREAALHGAGVGTPRLVVQGPPEALLPEEEASALPDPGNTEHQLAYILYTSGSTGVPKGVCISHLNALAFIRWAAGELKVTARDRFANHAPFFFDLSVLDLYVAFLCGGHVSVVPEGLAYSPRELVRFLVEERISIWYSVPSALILMAEQGGLLEARAPQLRVVLFAGEPYPVKHLRRLRQAHPGPRYLNLYGPTETNVCTFYEVTTLEEQRVEPVPIGKVSCGDRAWIAHPAPRSEEDPSLVGELMVEGPTVMLGYWGRPPHQGPYPTGDLVRVNAQGDYEYLGRRDNMVKVRGRRIELGDIEAALLSHPQIHEVAVVVAGEGLEARLVAFLVPPPDSAAPSLLALKRHCSERLPRYMIVDSARPLPALPRTRNGKVDRLALAALLQG